jgi:hypothetical protein
MEYLTILFFLVVVADNCLVVGEVYIDGQNRDVWCNSKKLITDLNVYYYPTLVTDPSSTYATIPSCYVMYASTTTPTMRLLIRSSSECLPTGNNVGDYVLCE